MPCSGEHVTTHHVVDHRVISLLIAFILAFTTIGAASASAHEVEEAAPALEAFDLNSMVFPLISDRSPIVDTFDACRSGCSRIHGAIDLMRDKMVPIVAVADGVVSWMGTVSEGNCCYLFIDHPGDYKTGYIHMNNDTPGTDDGLGNGIAEGIVEGAIVRKGQLLGWVGDSGNAEYSGSHLHFEIRYYGNGFEERINPYPYLLEAPILSAPEGPVVEEPFVGATFSDDNGSPHEADIERLVAMKVTRGCSETEYCPLDEITRGQMAAFIRRYLELPAVEVGAASYSDITGHLFEEDIEAITAAGIGFGCGDTTYCADDPLKRNEMAKFLVLAFGFPAAGAEVNAFPDDDGDPFEDYIDAIELVGVTKGCTETTYCPTESVTREQMASFFIRSHDLIAG